MIKINFKERKYSLQPLNGELVDGQEINKMVENISEQDYYEKVEISILLKGMSIAIILDPKGGTNATLSEGSIDSYAKETISRLYKYLQNKKSVKDILLLLLFIVKMTVKKKKL